MRLRRFALSLVSVIVLACAWVPLNLVQANFGEFVLEHYRALLALFGTLAVFLSCLCLLTLKEVSATRARGFALAASAAVLLFFNYPTASTAWHGIAGAALYRSVYLLLILGAVAAVFYLFRDKPRAVTMALVLLGAANGVCMGTIAAQWARQGKAPKIIAAPHPGALSIARKRNVYYIIVDAYGRADQLRRIGGYDNKPFLKTLRDDGFTIMDQAYANYPITPFSLASLFNMDYMITEKGTFVGDKQIYTTIRYANPAVDTFKASGYRFLRASTGTWDGSQCSGTEDVCLNTAGFIPDELERILNDLTPLQASAKVQFKQSSVQPQLEQTSPHTEAHQDMQGKPKEKVKTRTASSRMEDLFTIDMLTERVQELQRYAPFLLFAHTLPPHPPYLLDKKCQELPTEGWNNYNWDADSMKYYIEGVQCVNSMIQRFVKMVKAEDPEAIIVIHGDHGTAFTVDLLKVNHVWSDDQFNERYGVLMAIHAPPSCREWLYPSLSPVNTMRFVFGCLENHSPRYIPDKYYILGSPYHKNYGTVREYLPKVH